VVRGCSSHSGLRSPVSLLAHQREHFSQIFLDWQAPKSLELVRFLEAFRRLEERRSILHGSAPQIAFETDLREEDNADAVEFPFWQV